MQILACKIWKLRPHLPDMSYAGSHLNSINENGVGINIYFKYVIMKVV